MFSLIFLLACGSQESVAAAPKPEPVPAAAPVAPAPAPTAPAIAPAAPAAAACSVVGKWTGTLPAGPQPWNGKPISGEFKSDGIMDATTPMGTRSVSYAVEGSTLTFTHATAKGPGACGFDDVGHYTAAFGADCNTVEFTKVDDACAGRSNGLIGFTLTRG